MLTDVQKAYIEKTRAVRLTFDGYADLYNFPLLGSHTVADAMEIENKRKQFFKKERFAPAPVPDFYTAAEDRFIDENGMSSSLF